VFDVFTYVCSECYTKAEILRQKQELYRQKRLKNQQTGVVAIKATSEPDQSSDSEHEELEEFLDWRSKVV